MDYHIFVCIPNAFFKKVAIKKTMMVSALDHILPTSMKLSNWLLVSKGNIITPNNTFEHYGIGQNDFLLLIHKKCNPSSLTRIMHLFNRDETKDKIINCMNHNLRGELFRLKDFRQNRIENSKRKYRQHVKRATRFNEGFNANLFMLRNAPNSEKTFIGMKALSPSTEPLPILWS